MNDWFGSVLRLRLFGQSHCASVGMELAGFPAGFAPDIAALQRFLDRRRPGQGAHTTARAEADVPVFSGGLTEGRTDGQPLRAEILNTDVRPQDYGNQIPRPSHADYPAYVKYGAIPSGGGVFSGRMTAALCIAGGLCLQWLEARGVRIDAHALQIGTAHDRAFDPLAPELPDRAGKIAVLRREAEADMLRQIALAREAGDSVGGSIECAITGLFAGLGEPLFGGLEGRLSQLLFVIPAVKGVRFGASCAEQHGSAYNDPFYCDGGAIRTRTNHAGGILGGLSSGMPVLFSVECKPTPSIAAPQESVSLPDGASVRLELRGRHDPCIVPRAVPCVEAAAAIGIMDVLLEDAHGACSITKRN